MSIAAQDQRFRMAAFDWLAEQVDLHGEALRSQVLAGGFSVDDTRLALFFPQKGIWKPRVMRYPLSITTSPSPARPYDDGFSPDGLLLYRYRGTNPDHADNRGLRAAMQDRIPMIYLHGIVSGLYLAAWPVYIVGDDPAKLTFSAVIDDASNATTVANAATVAEEPIARRRYVTALVRRRLHQQTFRVRVLRAYRKQCALCRLKHEALLDAAHIVADVDPAGEPRVPNGLSLCKIHHAAYDRLVIGITPDYTVTIRQDILEEEDGPMLRHGLQGLHGQRLVLPRRAEWRPDRGALEMRYERFLRSRST